MPSGTSATVELLARLQAATGKPDYADVVQRIVSGLASTVRTTSGVGEYRRSPQSLSGPGIRANATADARPSASGQPSVLNTADHVRAAVKPTVP